MKKTLAIFCTLVLAASAANAQSGLLNSLKGVLGGNSSSSSAVESAANGVLGSLIGSVLNQTTTVTLTGNWTYNGSATAISTDNTLTTLAASAYKENLENKADGYLAKVGIKPGVATLSFAEDGTFTIAAGGKNIASGTYTYADKVVKMKFGKVYNYLSMTGDVAATTSGCQVLFPADKFLKFASKAVKVVGAASQDSTLSSLTGLVDQVTGLKLGFDLKR